jgi:ketosteroid isomerase-like protein
MSLAPGDMLEILQLIARADDRAGARDADGYAALFTEDAVMDGDQGRAEGRTQLADAVARVWAREPAGTLHLTLNAVIEDTVPEPTVTSVMLIASAGAPSAILASARVAQKVRRTQHGWRITERRIATPATAAVPLSIDQQTRRERSTQ